MPEGLYRGDPLSPTQREDFEEDLISFCDRALELLGDIRGLDVIYAGGASPLWLEGLAERVGSGGSLTAFDADEESVLSARRWVADTELPCVVSVLAGDVFSPPLSAGSFDLVYSAGLLHELDVSRRPAQAALSALASLLRPRGKLATEDFVDSGPAAQIEEERIEDELRRYHGESPYGIGPVERLVSLHERVLERVSHRRLPPFTLRHLNEIFLAREEPAGMDAVLRERWLELRERVLREGYTRPATLYVEGRRIS